MIEDGVGLGPTAAFLRLRSAVEWRHPGADLDHLHAIAVMAAECHRGQHRRSGDQYVTHPFIVATYVAEWGRSLACVQAAVLHDVLEGGWDPPILRGSVDDGVVDMIELIYDLDRGGPAVLDGVPADLAADALAIKLADRLHNARTWRFIPPDRAQFKARETIALYAPAAARAGLHEVGLELNQLARSELAEPRGRAAEPVAGVEVSSSSIVGWAVNRLPPAERDRYAQEWAADLSALHSRRERWTFKLGILWSARRMR